VDETGPIIDHRAVVGRAWEALGDDRQIISIEDASANVSTNRVYRLHLSDGRRRYAKVSNYGSYFLFTEDHDRIHRWNRLLQPTRFATFLAEAVTRDGKVWTYYGRDIWAVFYEEVPLGHRLGRVLDDHDIENLAVEMAEFHRVSADLAPHIPLTSKTIKSDAIGLLDQLTNPFSSARFRFDDEQLKVARHHCHTFLMRLDELGYDDVPKQPVLIDWNLGNFSVHYGQDGRFALYSRWDYDWFRIEPRALDFYFLSRVSSQTGDRTRFTYGSHPLLEPRFAGFLRRYHQRFPLQEVDIDLIGEGYRFFILNYVLREGDAFFHRDLSQKLMRDAVEIYLPAFDAVDLNPLKEAVLT
jgi:hypothetical protein